MDLHKYEKRLVEEWELVFDAMCDELGEAAIETAKEGAARNLLAWAEQTLFPIRPNVTEPFVSRGSLHMLSDDLRVGWHIDFQYHLARLLVVDFRNRYNVVWNRVCAYNKVVSPTALGGNRCLDRSRSINPSLRRRRSQRLVGLHDNERHPAPMFTGPRWS